MIIKEHTGEKVSSSCEVARVLSAILHTDNEVDRDKEHFWVIGLNTKNVIKFIDLVSLGTLTNALIHPREVFRLSVMKGVCSIIAGHNHPSGDPTPSKDDVAITERLKHAGDILGISVLDHVIIGDNNQFTSLKERGLL
ncbi:MAG: DNA repair protein RadC [Alphaproteobacteria bacterium]|uniref:DNA repair protein RadC n=1 Tax=Candidatus Nitrobium versatile TaxID=2884831 RepID=A0A953J3I9_9BACT|nr:DNA repair protein RadC [Candidatus Nitrobium versatile]